MKYLSDYFPKLPKKLEGLYELAFDQSKASIYLADELWKQINPTLWEKTRNPWLIMQTTLEERWQTLSKNKEFCKCLKTLLNQYFEEESSVWFYQTYPRSSLIIAYFSLEFGLSESLPIYSGGLGVLAGDYLKTADDLGLPLVGIGLLYQEGYFRQLLDKEGRQHEFFPYNDPSQIPISPLKDKEGNWVNILLDLPGRKLRLRVWLVRVGKIFLYLLDSNDLLNSPVDRGITGELYGGREEKRLLQEYVLGIGGGKLLSLLNLHNAICHLNEGHAAFVVLERAKAYMEAHSVEFLKALFITRSANLFTTHTAVSAGFDRFPRNLMERYFTEYARQLSVSLDELLSLGKQDPFNPHEPFNMAFLAIKGSLGIGGVSKLHGEVSRDLFSPLFPRWPTKEVPVGYVTNGVHIPSWESSQADRLWRDACGEMRWKGTLKDIDKKIMSIEDKVLWNFRNEGRKNLIHYARNRLLEELKVSGFTGEALPKIDTILDENILTIGFARRFASYKRPNLLLYDSERFKKILMNQQCPIQLIIAGKAHPQDEEGKQMIYDWINFIRNSNARHRIVFLSDYDILLAERLVQGVDLWLNTPRRPWEASGTSGMKVLVNGGLNCSELDGWWAEAYQNEMGWAIGDKKTHENQQQWDEKEAEALYSLLEKEIIPLFYERDSSEIPTKWLNIVRKSMANLTIQYSSNRMVREYVQKYYIPQLEIFRKRDIGGGNQGLSLYEWVEKIQKNWHFLAMKDFSTSSFNGQAIFKVQVYLGNLSPDDITLQLYAAHEIHEMQMEEKISEGTYHYKISIQTDQPLNSFTPRILPKHSAIFIPLEINYIYWMPRA